MSDPNQLPDPHGRHGYDPTQPRVPAGQSTGGQWTDTDGPNLDGAAQRKVVRDTSGQEAWNFYYNMYRPDGSLAEQVVFNRDRSRIISEYNEAGGAGDWNERHTVITPDSSKFTFETSGDTQTIYDGDGRPLSKTEWTDDGLESQPIVQQAFLQLGAQVGRVALKKGIEAALALFTWLSARNNRDSTAVFAFKAAQYRKEGPDEAPDAVWVGRLNRDEVNDVCKKFKNMQDLTDGAVDKVRRDGKFKGPADFGTKVHKIIADGIRSQNDHNFRAEVSLIKSKLERDADYGEEDSIRIDGFENRPRISTVCIYDPKTGRGGLPPSRMTELAQTVQRVYPRTQRIIVIEVRPGQK
jgi:hypothetical protein